MTDITLRIYDYMRRHTMLCVTLFCLATALLVGLVSRIRFTEDISAFLPLEEQHKESLQVYQDISGASKLLAIFQLKDTTQTDAEELICAVNDFEHYLSTTDTSGIIREAENSDAKQFIIGTEYGVVERLTEYNPDKKFWLLSPKLVCINMKMTSLINLRDCLKDQFGEIDMPEELRMKAFSALDKMMRI